jgi:hypothetical protein
MPAKADGMNTVNQACWQTLNPPRADWKRQFGTVASGILPDVEGGILPPGSADNMAATSKLSAHFEIASPFPPGWKPRLYGRQDARRYVPRHIFPKQPLQSRDATVISVQTEIEEIWQH